VYCLRVPPDFCALNSLLSSSSDFSRPPLRWIVCSTRGKDENSYALASLIPKLLMALTDKQKRFVEDYLVDLNATQAAVRAGYSAKTAEQQAYQILQKTSVSEAIAAAQAARSERTELTQDWVLDRLREVTERCMQHEALLDHEGNPTGEYKFNASGANKSIELIGKHLGMFKDNLKVKLEISHEDTLSELE
jgi:phage terminase small subunit